MDWANVTGEDLIDALRQVDWKARPRPLAEMVRKFSIPTKSKKWTSRLKCNVYYYRANYFLMLLMAYLVNFYRNPLQLLGLLGLAGTLLCLNDNFATLMNDRLMRVIRKISPSTAVKLRSLARPTGGRLDKSLYICGFKRKYTVLFLGLLSCWLMYWTSALTSLLWTTLMGVSLIGAHASLRTHNLKAKMASAREEFRAVWRGGMDYTL